MSEYCWLDRPNDRWLLAVCRKFLIRIDGQEERNITIGICMYIAGRKQVSFSKSHNNGQQYFIQVKLAWSLVPSLTFTAGLRDRDLDCPHVFLRPDRLIYLWHYYSIPTYCCSSVHLFAHTFRSTLYTEIFEFRQHSSKFQSVQLF